MVHRLYFQAVFFPHYLDVDETGGEVTFWRAEIMTQRLTDVVAGGATGATACAAEPTSQEAWR